MNMNMSKKFIVAASIGTFILAGTAGGVAVYAAEANHPAVVSERCPGQMDQQKMLEHMTGKMGISQDDIKKYQAKGYALHDIGAAAFLSKVSGKTLDEVITLKTADNSWQDVAGKLGVTKEQIKTMRNNGIAEHISGKLHVDKQELLQLLNQGYHPRDIGMAAKLAGLSSKSVEDVLAMKKINNSWRDVAAELGITKEQLKEARNNDIAEQFSTRLHVDKQAVVQLLSQGYHPRDIGMAAKIAGLSGKSIDDVLAMKKTNNSWQDVAGELNISPESLHPQGEMHGHGPKANMGMMHMGMDKL